MGSSSTRSRSMLTTDEVWELSKEDSVAVTLTVSWVPATARVTVNCVFRPTATGTESCVDGAKPEAVLWTV